MDLGRHMSRPNHSKSTTGRSERLFNDLPLHLYSRYVDSHDFLSRPRRPASTDAGAFSSTSLPRVTSVSTYYPSSAPTSPVPPYTRSSASGWQVPTSSTSYTPSRPLSTGATTLSLPSREQSKSPIYSPVSASPYSTRSPSPSLQQQEQSRAPVRPASPYYASSIYDRSPVPPPPPARFSSYQVTIPPSPPRPTSPPPPPPRMYSFVPALSSSRSPTIKTVSERLLDLERDTEETASSIARLPDSHEISSEGNMLANDLDRSVSRSESFIKEVEEKLLGLGHKVELPSYSPSSSSSSSRSKYVTGSSERSGRADKYASHSSHDNTESSDAACEKTPTRSSPEKEYVGWRQRMGSVYEIEIKDEKQLLDEIGRRKKRSIGESVSKEKDAPSNKSDLISVLASNDSLEIRKRRESNKPRETREPSERKDATLSSGGESDAASSCFAGTSAWEERKKEQKAKAVSSQAWNVKEYLPQILGGLLILWIIISLMMSGKKVDSKTKIQVKTSETVKRATPAPLKAVVQTEKPQIVKTTKVKQEKATTTSTTTTTTTTTTRRPEKAKKDNLKEKISTTIAPSVRVAQDAGEKTAKVKEQSKPITLKGNSSETVKTSKKRKEIAPSPSPSSSPSAAGKKETERKTELPDGKIKSPEGKTKSPEGKTKSPGVNTTATPVLPDDKRLEKAAKVVKKAIKECESKFEMSSDKIKKIIEKTAPHKEQGESTKVKKSEKAPTESKRKAERQSASVNQTDSRVEEVTEGVKASKTKKVKVNKSSSNVTKEEDQITATVKSVKKQIKSTNATVSASVVASAVGINVTAPKVKKSAKSKQESVTGEKKEPVKDEETMKSVSLSSVKQQQQSAKNVSGKSEPGVKKEKKKVTINRASVNVTVNSNVTLSTAQGNNKSKGNK